MFLLLLYIIGITHADSLPGLAPGWKYKVSITSRNIVTHSVSSPLVENLGEHTSFSYSCFTQGNGVIGETVSFLVVDPVRLARVPSFKDETLNITVSVIRENRPTLISSLWEATHNSESHILMLIKQTDGLTGPDLSGNLLGVPPNLTHQNLADLLASETAYISGNNQGSEHTYTVRLSGIYKSISAAYSRCST